nr:DUF445 domain-containing protein [uncultured Flavobacterium sp.]
MSLGFIVTSILIKNNSAEYLKYIRAFCEAAMIGALADWFAVTALFKKPLGLNIPHTNLIENSKDDIGENLGKFVSDNFLNPTNIKPYIKKLDGVNFILNWIKVPANKKKFEDEVKSFIINFLKELNDHEVIAYLNKKSTEIIRDFSISEPVFKISNHLITENQHNKLIDKLLPYLKNYINDNKDFVKDQVTENAGFVGMLFGNKISNSMVSGLNSFIEEIQQNPNHQIRLQIEYQLLEYITKLQTDEQFKLKLNSIKNDFFTTDQINHLTSKGWISFKENTIKELENPESSLNKYLTKYSNQFITQLKDETILKNRINIWIQTFSFKVIAKNSNYIATLIATTVKNWDGKELSEKLETEVGKDLQFIRINGTIIGGLIGVLIYTLTQFFIK